MASNDCVDARTCTPCHATIARGYAKTGTAQAFFVPAAATWYEIASRNEDWFQRWWQSGAKRNCESQGEAQIDFVMGSGNHVRTYLHRTAGGTWALNPGFDTPDPPTGRKIGTDCMFCHNAYPANPPSCGNHFRAVQQPNAQPAAIRREGKFEIVSSVYRLRQLPPGRQPPSRPPPSQPPRPDRRTPRPAVGVPCRSCPVWRWGRALRRRCSCDA